MTLPAFVDLLNSYTERPVLDMTGIQGAFDIELDVSADEVRNAARAHGANLRPPPPGETAADPAGVSLFTSIQQLGLKLEPRKAPVEVVVVDKADKVPTQN